MTGRPAANVGITTSSIFKAPNRQHAPPPFVKNVSGSVDCKRGEENGHSRIAGICGGDRRGTTATQQMEESQAPGSTTSDPFGSSPFSPLLLGRKRCNPLQTQSIRKNLRQFTHFVMFETRPSCGIAEQPLPHTEDLYETFYENLDLLRLDCRRCCCPHTRCRIGGRPR